MRIDINEPPNTEIKKIINLFSKEWESYVESCQNKEEPNLFRVSKNHLAYDLLINQLPKEFERVLDNTKYKVVSSVGDGNLAGIPWLCILDREVTDSVTQEFYVSILFSRNAKKMYISITFGAQQFFDTFGENTLCIEKIKKVKDSIAINFLEHAPHVDGTEYEGQDFYLDDYDEIDLKQKKDKDFFRKDFSKKINMKVSGYTHGSFYSKMYSLDEINKAGVSDYEEKEFLLDINEYLACYDVLKVNSTSELIEVIVESKAEAKKNRNLDYEIPEFNPSMVLKSKKNINLKGISKNKSKSRYSPESKKTGDAGEKHVYDFEYNKLKKNGREDLAKRIIYQSKDLSHFPGYDICSFDKNGNEMFIEVKSSKGKNIKTFDITSTEWNSAVNNKEKYFIYIVENALKKPKIIAKIQDPENYVKNSKIKISPSRYKVDI